MTGSHAAGYVTDYFPGIEGLALLYQTTHDQRYLRQAERMADFFQRFDGLPIDHSHGNLVTHYGLLGLQTLKSHVVVGSPKGAFVNFPLDATAPVRTGRGRWKVSVSTAEARFGEVECRVRIDPLEGATKAPDVFVRRPSWAARVAIADRAGRVQRATEEGGYFRLSLRPGAEREATITFTAAPRVEDRRMGPVALNPKATTRHAGVTLSVGPHLLLANVDKPRPVLVARVGPDGTLRLPMANRFPLVGSLEATDAAAIQAIQSPSRLRLSPWETVGHDTSVAFVFDLLATPAAKERGWDVSVRFDGAINSGRST